MLNTTQEPRVVAGPRVGMGYPQSWTQRDVWLISGEEDCPGWGHCIPLKSPAFKPKSECVTRCLGPGSLPQFTACCPQNLDADGIDSGSLSRRVLNK